MPKMIIGASAAGSGAAMPIVVLDVPAKARRQSVALLKPVNQAQQSEPIQMEKTMTASKANYEKITNDAASLGKDQVEAYVKSATILAKGGEEILKTCVALGQATAEKNTAAFKTLLGCKTLSELTEVHNKLTQDSIEGFISNATKLSELSIKVATDSFEPLNSQYGKTIKKASDAMAA